MPRRKKGAVVDHPVKRQLATLISDAIRDDKICQYVAASRMGIDQPKVSHILHGRLQGYSTQRLLELLAALGRDVDIIVTLPPRPRRLGVLRVGTALSS